MSKTYCYTETPLGSLLLAGDFQGLAVINFQDANLLGNKTPMLPESHWRKDAAFFVNAIVQFREYFAGQRQRFSLRLNPLGSEFEREVLAAISRIPYGETVSYKDVARYVGKPKSVRAVASACHRNPLPIMIPCHRVIGANGKPTGSQRGVDLRLKMLDMEKSGSHWPTDKAGGKSKQGELDQAMSDASQLELSAAREDSAMDAAEAV